jgi:HAD superfamily hydrolase (TIGR01450 family)
VESLADRYDALFVDLDGVVYRGDRPVDGAAEALDEVRRRGARILFLTNNSSLTPDDVADKIRNFGVSAEPGEVLTSGMATAAMLAREGAQGRTAFVIGERGVREALEGAGVRIIDGDPVRTDLVVVGWDRSADYAKLRRAGLLVQRGARLIATNPDTSYPAPDGLWPGGGALLAAITATTGAAATIVGKPARPLFQAAAEMSGAHSPLVVGDRLDTDVSGAAAMGWAAFLVFSGVSQPADLLRAWDLPAFIGPDLSGLLTDAPPARFRTARPDDAPGISKLLEATGLSAQGAADRVSGALVMDGSRAGSEDGLAATATVEPLGADGLLRSVAVREDLRGFGLGMLAVAAAAGLARTKGLRRLALFTEHASGFFGRLGFRWVDRPDLPELVRTSPQALEECAAGAVAMVADLVSAQSQGEPTP